MSNKPGSSNYDRGDCGGSHGDYEHGVSHKWVNKMVTGAKTSPKRDAKFYDKMVGHVNKGKMSTSRKARTAIGAMGSHTRKRALKSVSGSF